MKHRPDYACADCGIDVDKQGEYSWMVKDALWEKSLSAARRRRGIHQHRVSTFDLVCVGCFERRIHRQLTEADFAWRVPLSFIRGHRSKTLLARMGPRLQEEQKRHRAEKREGLG